MSLNDALTAFLKILEQIFKVKPVRHPILRPDPVFIIGMHRSGTSALGGVLENLGLSVGKTVMAPNAAAGNPLGYYENQAMVDVHDGFLSEIKHKWLDPYPIPRRRFRGTAAKRFRPQLVDTMVSEFGGARPLIKDPRLCELMPLWKPVVQKYFPQAWFVVPIRSPLEVAASLKKRDKFSMEHGVGMWAVHVLEAELGSRGFNRFFTTYEKLLATPEATVSEIARQLRLPANAVPGAVSKQVDPSLRTHADLLWPDEVPHRELVQEIHQVLTEAPPDLEVRLDGLRRQYYKKMKFRG